MARVTIEDCLDKEQNRFRFQPKRVSLEMYGTVDYWSLILYINECPSVIDFEPEKLTFPKMTLLFPVVPP